MFHFWQACSFILASPDVLKYSALYETLVGLLGVSLQVDRSLRKTSDVIRSSSCDIIKLSSSDLNRSTSAEGGPRTDTTSSEIIRSVSTDSSIPRLSKTKADSDGGLSFLGHCAVQYTFSIVYRILLTLPPSVSALETLSLPDSKLEGPWLLHALIWGPRASHKIYNGWIKVRINEWNKEIFFLLKKSSKKIPPSKKILLLHLWYSRRGEFFSDINEWSFLVRFNLYI